MARRNGSGVQQRPVITSDPSPVNTAANTDVWFQATATGATSFHWEVSRNQGTTWEIYSPEGWYYIHNGMRMGTHARADMNGWLFRMVATNSAGSTPSNGARLTVNVPAQNAPTITQDLPNVTTGRIGQEAVFFVAFNGNPTPTVQWVQANPQGSNLTNIPHRIVTNANGSTLFVTVGHQMHRWVFRADITNAHGGVNSTASRLNVIGTPSTPTNAGTSNLTRTAMTVHWGVGTGGAPATGFSVSVYQSNVRIRNYNLPYSDLRHHRITNLQPGTWYTIRIVAHNGNDTSNAASSTIRTLSADYHMHVNHFFDLTFASRSGTLAESRRRISTAHNEAAHILLDIFGLNMTSNLPSERTSQPDLCRGTAVGGGRIFTGVCPANCWRRPVVGGRIDTSPEAACTYRWRIRDQFISNWGKGTQRNPIVLWTGHNQLTATTNDRHRDNAGSVIWRGDGSVFMTLMTAQTTLRSNNNLNDFNYNAARNVFLHEMAHQLGANDHYCYWRHTYPDDPAGPRRDYAHINGGRCDNPNDTCWACDFRLEYPPNCVMTSSSEVDRFNTRGRDIFCSTCHSIIGGYLFRHHR